MVFATALVAGLFRRSVRLSRLDVTSTPRGQCARTPMVRCL